MLDMLVSIGILIGALALGVIAGILKKTFTKKQEGLLSKAMTVLVFILILLMGIKTGMNQMVVANIGSFGLNALLIALSAIAGSIIFAIIFEKLLLKGTYK